MGKEEESEGAAAHPELGADGRGLFNEAPAICTQGPLPSVLRGPCLLYSRGPAICTQEAAAYPELSADGRRLVILQPVLIHCFVRVPGAFPQGCQLACPGHARWQSRVPPLGLLLELPSSQNRSQMRIVRLPRLAGYLVCPCLPLLVKERTQK